MKVLSYFGHGHGEVVWCLVMLVCWVVMFCCPFVHSLVKLNDDDSVSVGRTRVARIL